MLEAFEKIPPNWHLMLSQIEVPVSRPHLVNALLRLKLNPILFNPRTSPFQAEFWRDCAEIPF
jgi:hypothetical protein